MVSKSSDFWLCLLILNSHSIKAGSQTRGPHVARDAFWEFSNH